MSDASVHDKKVMLTSRISLCEYSSLGDKVTTLTVLTENGNKQPEYLAFIFSEGFDKSNQLQQCRGFEKAFKSLADEIEKLEGMK